MARPLSWSQLKTGLFAAVAIALLVFAVLRYAQIGALHGRTTHLYTVVNAARGVIRGTEVWVGGEKVGLVSDVELRPPSADTTERIAIAFDVHDENLPLIRRDSRVDVGPGGSLIGAPVVSITVGTPAAAALRAGDTLRADPEHDQRPRFAAVGDIADSVALLRQSATQISADVRTQLGVISPLRSRAESQLSATRGALERFATKVHGGTGTVGLALGDSSSLRREISDLRIATDGLKARASSDHGAARFARDSSLVKDAHALLRRIDNVRSVLSRYEGNGADGTHMREQLTQLHASLDSLVSNVKSHPLRYLPF